jgi:nucleotide-binding universal stress UspA family protein
MYETILIPTDGSDHAVRAAEHGLSLADAFDADVHVVNVIDEDAAAVFDASDVRTDFLGQLEASGQEAVDKITEAGEDRTLHTELLRGEPAESIRSYADEHDADLVAMGTHARSGLDRYLLGSVTQSVIRDGSTPVLTARAEMPEHTDGYDEIMVPVDGSERAERALEDAFAIAETTDARIHAVNVVDIASVSTASGYAVEEFVERRKTSGENATEQAAEQARERGLDAVTAVRRGTPAHTLLAYADENGIDLITMATAGRSGIDRFLLGSTTERLIRESSVPVIAVQ